MIYFRILIGIFYIKNFIKTKFIMNNLKCQKLQELIKLIIIGDSGVGKTNILNRFCDGVFKQSYVATIGVDFRVKTVPVANKKLKLQLWDTAGQQRFKNLTQNYYKGSAGIILVYSIDDRKSFNNLQGWIRQIEQNTQKDVKKIILGNKCDLIQKRTVTEEDGKKMSMLHKIPFLEISAKDNININQSFDILVKQINEEIELLKHPDYRLNLHQNANIKQLTSIKKPCSC